jgi:hypothetical protein
MDQKVTLKPTNMVQKDSLPSASENIRPVSFGNQ